jgi:DNA-binding winged helix-turn-helix (wHTH) protein/Tol biopolymer transport system component
VPTRERQLIRFGPFQLDLHAGELFKNGVRLKLQPQPIQVLAVLLEKPGELITREEFRQQLWPADTFVDFEHSLNTAVKKLRQALGDEAETPLYIETLPRRGYRFVETVEKPNPGQDSSGPVSVAPTQLLPDSEAQKRQRTSPRPWRWGMSALIFPLLAIAYYFVKLPTPIKVGNTRRLTRTPYKKTPPPGQGVILTDGARIYFPEYRDAKWQVSEVSTMGGEVSVLTTGLHDLSPYTYLGDLSPDLSVILLREYKLGVPEARTWLVPLPEGSSRPLPFTSFGWSLFAPHGHGFLYSAHQGKDLYQAGLNGENPRWLMTLPDITCPRVSPDGGRLRFTVLPNPQISPSIWEVGMDGSNPHPLFADQRPTSCGVWSSDGKLFAFHRWSGTQWDLWVSREDKRWLGLGRPKPVQLTSGAISYPASSTFSRDGNVLYSIGTDTRGDLATYAQNSRESTPFLPGISAYFVAFSADNQWVAYVTYPEGTLWRSRTDGSQRMQLSFAPMVAMLPRWSPDGKLIAFTAVSSKTDLSNLANGPGHIYLVPAEGGTPMLLRVSCANDATWSPDGSSLACGGCMTGIRQGLCPEMSGVNILDLNSQNSRVLPGSEDLWSPRWSPDGKHLVALAGDGRTLWLYTFGNKSWVRLASAKILGFPEWSRDSRYIYYVDASNDILKIDISNRYAEAALSIKDIPRTGRYADWFTVTPGDKILLLRNTGSEDVYALDLKEP